VGAFKEKRFRKDVASNYWVNSDLIRSVALDALT